MEDWFRWQRIQDSCYEVNSKGQFNEFRNKISEQKEYITKDIETVKKNQMKFLELTNSIYKMRTALERPLEIDQMEEGISKLEDRNLEITQEEGEN